MENTLINTTAKEVGDSVIEAIRNISIVEHSWLVEIIRAIKTYKEVIFCFDAVMSDLHAKEMKREILDKLEFIRQEYGLIPASASNESHFHSLQHGEVDNPRRNKLIITFKPL